MYRVKDEETKHEYTVTVVLETHQVLDKPAVNSNGVPLPAKPHVKVRSPRSASKKGASATRPDTTKAKLEATE